MCMNSIWARDKNIQLAWGIFSFKTFVTSGPCVYHKLYFRKAMRILLGAKIFLNKKIHKSRMILVQGVVCNFPTSHPPRHMGLQDLMLLPMLERVEEWHSVVVNSLWSELCVVAISSQTAFCLGDWNLKKHRNLQAGWWWFPSSFLGIPNSSLKESLGLP